jgi:hypothetical protein
VHFPNGIKRYGPAVVISLKLRAADFPQKLSL